MPVFSLKSKTTLESSGKPLHHWPLDRKWAKICQDVVSPFPQNRILIKHELKKDYKVKFDEEVIKQECKCKFNEWVK